MQAFTNLLDEEPRMFLFEHVFTISVGMESSLSSMYHMVLHCTQLLVSNYFSLEVT